MAGGKRGCLAVVGGMLLLLIVLVVGAASWLWLRQANFGQTPLSPTAPSVVIAAGDGFGTVLAKLRQAGVDEGSDMEWQLLARRMDAAGKLKVGEYSLEPAPTAAELLQRMADGKVMQHRLTIVEGWNMRQVRAALARATPLVQTLQDRSDSELMSELGFPGQHPEGRFLPETYVYQRGESDLDVLRRAHAGMEKALDEAWQSRADNLPLNSPYEMLTLASIVEKETALASERPQIAGVFVRRLNIGMRLQTDPTVIYGMGSGYDGNIRKRDLTTDTPYNTYTRAGLTPTPIAMPSRDALQATARPADGNTLYFVAVGDGSGAHIFSATYAEHNAAVAKYLQQLRRNREAARQ